MLDKGAQAHIITDAKHVHSNAMIVRPATTNDAPALAALLRDVFAATYGAAIPLATLDAYLARAFAPATVMHTIRHPGTIMLVALDAGVLCGACELDMSPVPAAITAPDAIELARLYVAASHHGKGVAAALLDAGQQAALVSGHRTIWLYVWEQNHRARGFYRKYGFGFVGHAPVWVDDVRFDDVLMLKELA